MLLRQMIRTGGIAIAAVTVSASFAQSTPPAQDWQIGPVIKGRNYSVNMPPAPMQRRQGWSFDFPQPSVNAGHVHYLTFRHGSLTGRSRIVMRYRIDAPKGVRFIPQEATTGAATMTIYFQQAGDNWSAKGRYRFYRWYASQATTPIQAGTHELVIDLNDPRWFAVVGGTAGEFPEAFQRAKDNADRIGFVMGGPSGLGHGVYATGPARFTLLGFEVR